MISKFTHLFKHTKLPVFTQFTKMSFSTRSQQKNRNINQTQTDKSSAVDQIKDTVEHVIGVGAKDKPRDVTGSYSDKSASEKNFINVETKEDRIQDFTGRYFFGQESTVRTSPIFDKLEDKVEDVIGVGAKDKARDVTGSYYNKQTSESGKKFINVEGGVKGRQQNRDMTDAYFFGPDHVVGVDGNTADYLHDIGADETEVKGSSDKQREEKSADILMGRKNKGV